MKIRAFPGMIFGLLGLNASIVAVTVYLAHSDPSFAVVPDYYSKALAWDDTAAQLRHNAQLGWTAGLEVGGVGVAGRTVSVRVSDRSLAPIAGATVDVVAFHNARAGTQYTATLSQAAPGLYQASLPLDRPGQWEFRIRVRQGAETFTASTQTAVPSPTP